MATEAAPLNTPESRFRHSTRSLGTSFHDKAFSGFARSAFNARERKRIRLLVMRKWQICPVVSKIMINMFPFYRNFCYCPIVYDTNVTYFRISSLHGVSINFLMEIHVLICDGTCLYIARFIFDIW